MATRWFEYHQGPRIFEWTTAAIYKHSGIDLQAPCGTDITAPVEGTIVHSGTQPWGGQIDLATDKVPGYGPIIISYLHTSRQYVQAGDVVKPGESLGASGQPPPGGKYGGGCHIHFEVTHGVNAPYDSGKYSPSNNPDAKQHPMNPAPLLQWLLDGHAPPDQGHGGEDSPPPGSNPNCGEPPQPKDYRFGTSDPQYLLALAVYTSCLSNSGPASQAAAVSGLIGQASSLLGGIGEWVLNPLRIVKMLLGIGFVVIGLVIAFLPDLGAGGAAAVGVPELAPAASAAGGGHLKRAVGSLIRAGGRGIGAQRAATRQEQLRQRSTAKARTLEETRLQRAATTRRLRPAEQVQYAELRGQRGAEAERAARTAPLFMPRPPTARPAPRAPTPQAARPALQPVAGPGMSGGRAAGQPSQPMARGRYGTVRDLPHSQPLPTTQKGGRFGGFDDKEVRKSQQKIAKQAKKTEAKTPAERARISQKVAEQKAPLVSATPDITDERKMLDELRNRAASRRVRSSGTTPQQLRIRDWLRAQQRRFGGKS